MNTTTKIFAFLLAAALLLVGACRNASDDTNPSIYDLRVNGVSVPLGGSGEHQLSTIAEFEMNLSDNRGLAEFQMNVGGTLHYTQPLEGTTQFVTTDFAIESSNYSIGDTIQVIFTAEDEYGNIDVQPYFMDIVE